MTQLKFQALLAEKGLYVHYDVEDLHEDVKNLQDLGLLRSLVSDTSPIANLIVVGYVDRD